MRPHGRSRPHLLLTDRPCRGAQTGPSALLTVGTLPMHQNDAVCRAAPNARMTRTLRIGKAPVCPCHFPPGRTTHGMRKHRPARDTLNAVVPATRDSREWRAHRIGQSGRDAQQEHYRAAQRQRPGHGLWLIAALSCHPLQSMPAGARSHIGPIAAAKRGGMMEVLSSTWCTPAIPFAATRSGSCSTAERTLPHRYTIP